MNSVKRKREQAQARYEKESYASRNEREGGRGPFTQVDIKSERPRGIMVGHDDKEKVGRARMTLTGGYGFLRMLFAHNEGGGEAERYKVRL